MYRYCGNDPVNQVDPDGTEWGWRDLLDVAGFIPVVGEVADLANAVLYAAEGDWGNAALSAAGMIPVVGDLGKAARLGRKVIQEAVESGAGQVVKQEAKNTLQEQGKKHVNRTSGDNSYAQSGKRVHERFKQEAQKRGWRTERKLPSGRRPDAIDECGRPVELKPKTKRGMARGRK